MNIKTQSRARSALHGLCLPLILFLFISVGCRRMNVPNQNDNDLRDFQQVNLVANSALYNPATIDSGLHNAWGIAWNPTGIAWVNSQAGHVSALYTADGGIVRPAVRIPSPGGDTI